VDREGTIRYASVAVERILGYRAEDQIGRTLTSVVHPDDRDALARHLASIVERPGADVTGETRVGHADGRWLVFEWTARNLLAEPAIAGMVINAHDVTERTELEAQLRHQAFHDPLTGSPTGPRSGPGRARPLPARRNRAMPAVMFLDLDDFKTVNDTLGHGQATACWSRSRVGW
jgi:PAS domain S-box-containing protein